MRVCVCLCGMVGACACTCTCSCTCACVWCVCARRQVSGRDGRFFGQARRRQEGRPGSAADAAMAAFYVSSSEVAKLLHPTPTYSENTGEF